MTVVVEITVPSEAFDLGRVTQAAADLHVELERVVPAGEGVMPFFWAEGTHFEEFERNARDDELVESLTALARVDGRVLYHVV